MAEPNKTQFLKLNDLVAEYGLAKSSVYHFIKTQNFPRQIKLSGHSAVWRREAVDKWFADKESESMGAA